MSVTTRNKNNDICEEYDYFTDITAREEELRKLNEELDTKLRTTETEAAATSISFQSSVSPIVSSRKSGREEDVMFPLEEENNLQSWNDENSPNVDDKDIGIAAKVRIREARIKSLSTKLREAITNGKEQEKTRINLVTQVKRAEEEKKKLRSELDRYVQMERRRTDGHTGGGAERRTQALKNEVEDLRASNQSLKKELNSLKVITKESEAKSRSREVRLNRALESVDCFKKIVGESQSTSSGNGSGDGKIWKEKEQKMTKEIQELKKQNGNLMLAVKKQMKLIDVLKRQKIHLEASRLLEFTEKEFMKVLDWGSGENEK